MRNLGEPRSAARLVPRDRVVPERIIKPEGAVGQEFKTAFTTPRVGAILFELVAGKIDSLGTLIDEAETTARLRDEASSRVPDVYDIYKRGEVLVEAGQQIGEEQLILLRLEHDAAMGELTYGDKAQRALGILALVAALYFLAAAYIYRREPRFVENFRRVAMICGLVIAALASIRLLGAPDLDAEIVPVAIVGMIVAIAYNPSFGMMVTFGLSILTCITLGTQIPHFLVVMGGTAAAVLTLSEVRTRTKLIKVGATAAATYFLITWATGLWQDQPLDLVRNDSLWRAAGASWPASCSAEVCHSSRTRWESSPGSACSSLVTTPTRCFRSLYAGRPARTTIRSPSASIAEAAAERIDADGLLVRIGAYFHDIGKMLKPHYFVENQVGPTNRHAKLAPAMSTLIIIGHVKDGVDLGRQHHLPEPIIDLIEQHHGTTLVEYFYHEANRRNGNNPDADTGAGKLLPLSRSQAADSRGRHPDGRRRGRICQPDAFRSRPRTARRPRQRPCRQTAARRPV